MNQNINTTDAELSQTSQDTPAANEEAVLFPDFNGRIFRPPPGSPRPVKGRVVLVHGLNLAAATMDPLAHWLAAQGFVVARVVLSGHRDRFMDLVRIRHEAWQHDVALAVAALNRMEVDVREAPLSGVGFSLGGLLLSHHARKHAAHESWHGLALLAPAFIPRLATGFPVGVLPRWLPYFSFTPRRFRRWAFCPHSAYLAIGRLMRSHAHLVRKAKGPAESTVSAADLKRPKCLVLIHPRDELVHAGRLVDPEFGNGFDSYEVRYMRDVHRSWTVARHLICHPSSLTDAAWEDMCQQILRAIQPRGGS